MSNASTTPRMRSYGWNFHLVATSKSCHFAGLYQDPDNGFLTFRDLVDELRLCFEDDGNWDGVAFGLDNKSRHNANNFPLFITKAKLDTVIPSLPSPDPQERAIVRYHIVRHTECQLDENSPLRAHLEV
ncbi:uncharacterized protein FPOAC1_013213 [Fusarium poae]|uniref:uncharacterized protein n=1 Tax=Fusarium poae TaxID=36050 RepID=UPI001D042259|nr:uncharacterized protein FPOAC1_013213 [Fusarium poae]KAG8665234.1 hypothetical protein FPOAC1_013213 [Fusarium poae]